MKLLANQTSGTTQSGSSTVEDRTVMLRQHDRTIIAATFDHVKDRLQVTNCWPRNVDDDDNIFAKFVRIDNAKHILRETRPIACLPK